MKVKTLLLNLIVFLILLLIVESIASIAWFHHNRSYYDSKFASIDVIQAISHRLKDYFNPEKSKYEIIKELRENDKDIYPYYLYNPQLHLNNSIYHLSNPINSNILYCNESNYWASFTTDEIGFRNPSGQLEGEIDYIFIGDSFTAGACVKDGFTLADYFRAAGYSILNLGRGGSGPLFQLAVLREYGRTVKSKNVIWFVYTGNDLMNLREEKTTKLSFYLNDDSFTQDLYIKREENSDSLKHFLDTEIVLNDKRFQLGLNLPYQKSYGETLDVIDAQHKELELLNIVSNKIYQTANKLNAELTLVIINENYINKDTQRLRHDLANITSKNMVKFANEKNLNYLQLNTDQLINDFDSLYSDRGVHFSEKGYEYISNLVQSILVK